MPLLHTFKSPHPSTVKKGAKFGNLAAYLPIFSFLYPFSILFLFDEGRATPPLPPCHLVEPQVGHFSFTISLPPISSYIFCPKGGGGGLMYNMYPSWGFGAVLIVAAPQHRVDRGIDKCRMSRHVNIHLQITEKAFKIIINSYKYVRNTLVSVHDYRRIIKSNQFNFIYTMS